MSLEGLQNNEIVIKQEPFEDDEEECLDNSHSSCSGNDELFDITAVKEEVKIEPANDSCTDKVYAVLPEVKEEIKKEYSCKNSSPSICDIWLDPSQEDQYYSENCKGEPEDDSLQEDGMADPLQEYFPNIMPHFLSEGAETDKILQSRIISCHKCGEECTMENYMKHVQLKHKKSQPQLLQAPRSKTKKYNKKYLFPCPYCDKCPTSLSLFKLHLLTHSQEKPHKCPFCDYKGNTKGVVGFHIETKHFNIKRFKCELCDYACHTLSVLKNHIKKHYRKSKKEPHQCPHCEVITYSSHALRNHIKKKHKNLKK